MGGFPPGDGLSAVAGEGRVAVEDEHAGDDREVRLARGGAVVVAVASAGVGLDAGIELTVEVGGPVGEAQHQARLELGRADERDRRLDKV